MKLQGLSLLAALALLAPGLAPAEAQAGAREQFMQERFEAADRNGDGVITQDEVDARRSERFAKADVDGDGDLSIAEMQLMREQRRLRRLERRRNRLDSDGDGMVTAAEFTAARAGFFEHMDTDGDGSLTLDEMLAFRPRHHHR